MASLYIYRGYYHLAFTVNGKRKVINLNIKGTQLNKKKAELIKKEKEFELSNKKYIHYDCTLTQAAQLFSVKFNDPIYKIVLDYFKDVIPKVMLKQITRNDIELFHAYLSNKKLSKNTISNYFSHLNTFFRFCIENKLIEDNPCFRIPLEKTNRLPVPQDILDKVLSELKGDQYNAIKLLSMTGLRLSELCSLKWSDVDFENNVLTIHNTKGRRIDTFPLYPSLREFLWSFKGEGKVVPYNSRNSFKFWDRKLDKLKLPHYSLHSIRKRFGTNLARTTPHKALQEIMRHSNYRTTEEYYLFVEMEELGNYIQNVIAK